MNVNRREAILATSALAGSLALGGASSYASGIADDASLPGKTPHTKFAVNLEAWFRKLKFIDRLRRSAEWGYPAVELWDWRSKNIDEINRVRKECKIEIAQFTAWGFTPGLNDPNNHPAFLKAVEEACHVAHKLECRKMCVVAGNDQPGMTQQQMHLNVIEGLKRAAPIVEKYKVMLILEPMNIRVDHKGHCLYGSEPGVKICRAVNSPYVKLLFDLYHNQITEGDLARHVKEGFDQLGYVQVADNPGRNEPGTGEVCYARVYKELYDLGYHDFVGLECWPKESDESAAKRVFESDWR